MKPEEFDITGVQLETQRLILRPFCDNDLKDFHEYAKVEGVGEAAGWKHHFNISETRTILDVFIKGKRTFAIVEKQSGRVIGSLGIEPSAIIFERKYAKKRFCEIGYVLSKDKWGLGLMTEAVKSVLGYLFGVKKLYAVGCGHFVQNDRSRRVIEKCGFTYYGQAPYKTQLGTVEDGIYYVITRRQYRKGENR